jgi:hypothetical protein
MQRATFEEFRKDFSHDGPWMLFMGAAVSRAQPTNLPIAHELKELLITRLGKPLPEPRPPGSRNSSALALLERCSHTMLTSKRFYGQISDMPLDGLFATVEDAFGHSDIDVTRSLILPVYGSPHLTPNWNHLAIANLLTRPRPIIRLVVTTNFDCLIERAIELKHHRVRVFYRDEDFYEPDLEQLCNNAVPTLVKLHGSAHEGGEGSVISSIRQMGSGLIAAKREFLRTCLTSLNCLFVGYSGADWDVAPVISDSLAIGARRQRPVAYRLGPCQNIPEWWYDTDVKCVDADLRLKDENVFRHMLELEGLPTEDFRGEFGQ